MLRRIAEDHFGEWLDDLDLDKRDKFRLYQNTAGSWTAIYYNFNKDSHTIFIEAALGSSSEDNPICWLSIQGRRRKDRERLESLLQEKAIVELAESIGLEVMPEDQNEAEARIRLDGWSNGSGGIKPEFAEKVLEQIEKTKPFIEALLRPTT